MLRWLFGQKIVAGNKSKPSELEQEVPNDPARAAQCDSDVKPKKKRQEGTDDDSSTEAGAESDHGEVHVKRKRPGKRRRVSYIQCI